MSTVREVEGGIMSSEAKFPTAQTATPDRSGHRDLVLRLASSMIGAGFLGATLGRGIGAAIGLAAGLLLGILAVKNNPSQRQSPEQRQDSLWRG